MTTTPQPSPDDFTAAKEIFEKLQGLPSDRQQRVLRWVSEGLGVTVIGGPPPVQGLTAASIPAGQSQPQNAQVGAGAAHVDIKSFVAQKRPSSDMQFAAVAAYWFKFEAPPAQRKDAINAETLVNAARLAGRRRPPSPGMTLTNAKNQGYLDAASRGEYSINSVGENLVAMTLGGDATGAPIRPLRTKKKVRKVRGRKKNA